MLYNVFVTLTGVARVEANSEEEARQKVNKNDFNFEPFNQEVIDDAEIYPESDYQVEPADATPIDCQ